jgi:hypothetical protein
MSDRSEEVANFEAKIAAMALRLSSCHVSVVKN